MHELESIPDGRPGLEHKLRKIRQLIEDAKRDPAFRDRAAQVVAHVPERDQRGEVEAVFDFVRGGIRYLRDPWSEGGLELFTTPQLLLEQMDDGRAIGDCDDHVILAAAILETIGYRTRFRIGGLPPDHYRHIWLEAQTREGWLPLELVKKDEPFGYDPSSRFPLTLTTDGGTMFGEVGLGAPARKSAAKFTPAQIHGQMQAMKAKREVVQASRAVRDRRAELAKATDRATRFNMPLPTSIAKDLATSGAMAFRDQRSASMRQRQAEAAARPARRGTRGGRVLLGDYEVPPSFQNTPQEERWFGFTPSDVWRDDELADDVLGGFGSKLRKLTKKTSKLGKSLGKQTKRLGKNVGKLGQQAGRTMKREFTTHVGMLRNVVGGVLSIFSPQKQEAVATSSGGAMTDGTMYQPQPFQQPWTAGLYPPDLYEQGEAGMPADPWTGWDATTESQEVDSLYTPVAAEEMGPDEPMPGEGWGSYVPPQPWETTTNPFDDPAPGGEGMDYDAMDVMDPTTVYGQNEMGLGDLSWLENLAQQVGSTVLSYQQARLQAKAAEKGYPALQFGAQIPPVPATPVPSVPAQPTIITVPTVQEPAPARPPAAAGFAKWGPWVMVGVGGLVLVGLMSGVRRRR